MNAGTAVFGSLAGATAGLGIWQLQRRREKLQEMERRLEGLQLEPVSLEEALNQPPGERLFRRVSCRAKFDYSRQTLLGPRSAPEDPNPPENRIQPRGSFGGSVEGTGYWLLTPLRTVLSNGEYVEFVSNRGWAPQKHLFNGKNPNSRTTIDPPLVLPETQTKDGLEVTGVLRPGEKTQEWVFKGYVSDGRTWLTGDVQKIRDRMGLKDVPPGEALFFDVLGTADEAGEQWPRRKNIQQYLDFPTSANGHLGYAATWFTLSVLLVGMTRRLPSRGAVRARGRGR